MARRKLQRRFATRSTRSRAVKATSPSAKTLMAILPRGIVIANLAAQALPHVLGFVKDYLATKQVKKIKVGDLEIENPTPEDLQRFRAMTDSR